MIILIAKQILVVAIQIPRQDAVMIICVVTKPQKNVRIMPAGRLFANLRIIPPASQTKPSAQASEIILGEKNVAPPVKPVCTTPMVILIAINHSKNKN